MGKSSKAWLITSNSFSCGANSIVSAGSSGADTQDPPGELQLAKKPSEAQNLLSNFVTDDSQDSVTTRPISINSCETNGPTSQAGIKDRVDHSMTSRHDAESWDAEASVPAAHQLRAVSAGNCLRYCLHSAACMVPCVRATCHAALHAGCTTSGGSIDDTVTKGQ